MLRKMGICILGLLITLSVLFTEVRAAQAGVVTVLSEKIYAEKTTDSMVLANVIQGNKVEVLLVEEDENGNEWYYIKNDIGLEGWLRSGAVTMTSSLEQEENTYQLYVIDNVNIREMPSVDARIVGNIPRGEEVAYMAAWENEMQEIWYEITYQGVAGYVTADAVDPGENAMNPKAIEEMQQNEETTVIVEKMEIKEEATEEQEEYEERKESEIQETVEEIESVTEEETKQVTTKKKGILLPDRFEVALSLSIAGCLGILIFLTKKTKRMFKHK